MEIDEYWQVIQQKICPRCLDGDGHGECRLPVGEECALKAFLPQIVITVANSKSESIEGYVELLRRNVCILCDHQNADMSCSRRDHLECAIDRYYPLVIQIIETVRAKAGEAA